MSDAPQAQYFLLTTGLSRGQDDATAKKKSASWLRMHIRLEADGQWCAVNECEDGLLWFSEFARLPLPARAVPSTVAVYEKAEARYFAKQKLKRAAEKKEKDFKKQCAAGDIYGLHPERTKERIQRKEMEQGLAEAGAEPVIPAPAPERSEASLPQSVVVEQPAPVAEASLPLAITPAAGLLDDITVLDLEFQGTELLEIAAIRYVNGDVAGEYVSLVRFGGQVWAAITQVTGITTLHVSGATLPSEKQALQQFLKVAGGSLLVCHNISADKRVLEAARARCGATAELPNPWLCTMALARRRIKAGLLPKGQKYGLGDLCQHFKIPRRGAHRAKADVLMTYQLLRRLHEQQPLTKGDLHGAPEPAKAKKNPVPAGPGLFAAA